MTEGIYIAGCAQGPKDIPASVAQGAAAAARVLGKIQQKEIALEPVRATVNEEQCSGCRICNDMCPFNAILFHEDRMVSEVNPALCQGCGTCVAACPAGAISGTGFSNEQILAQIDGLLLLNLDKKEAGTCVASARRNTMTDTPEIQASSNPSSSALPATGAPTALPIWPAPPA